MICENCNGYGEYGIEAGRDEYGDCIVEGVKCENCNGTGKVEDL